MRKNWSQPVVILAFEQKGIWAEEHLSRKHLSMHSWAPAQMINTSTIDKISLAHCCSSAKFRRWLISKSFYQYLRQFLDHNFTFSWTKTCTLVNFAFFFFFNILDLKTALGANIWNTHLWIAASPYSKSVFPTKLVYLIRFWVRSTLANNTHAV